MSNPSIPGNPEVQITSCDRADLIGLAALAVQAYADTYGYTLSNTERGLEEAGQAKAFMDASRTDEILVARTGDAIVGYAQFGPRPDDMPDYLPPAELRKLYVATRLQGQGIGSRLMEGMLAHPSIAEAPVYLWVWGGNERAIRFYGHYGFFERGRRDYMHPNGDHTHAKLMVNERM